MFSRRRYANERVVYALLCDKKHIVLCMNVALRYTEANVVRLLLFLFDNYILQLMCTFVEPLTNVS